MKFKKGKYYKMEHKEGYFIITKVTGISEINDIPRNNYIYFDDFYNSNSNDLGPSGWAEFEDGVGAYFSKIIEVSRETHPEYFL